MDAHIMSSGARTTAVVALCLLTPLAAVLGGLSVLAGVVPLGVAVWLIAISPWSGRTRIAAVVAVVAAGVGLTVELVSALFSAGGFG